jgi:hypothetical protein
MEHDTTIPSLLGPMAESATKLKAQGASPVMKFAFWGLLAILGVLLYRFFKR